MVALGQNNVFEPGWEVPNDGWYVEIGEHPDSQNLHNPNRVYLKKGDAFPHTRNRNRKWTRDNNRNS
ncbi:YjzC family protein [Alicyclobacillus macrosporangiidus]|uniref:YjzC family protein n=1 Tax=Alicyclobacillus macrosporangiidus TaxID=392015 RepID=UPI003AFB1809